MMAFSNSSSVYEVIGRLFGRDRIRLIGSYLEAAGIGVSPEAFSGLYLFICISLSFLLFTSSLFIAPVRAAIYNLSLWVFFLKPLVLNLPPYIYIFAALTSITLVFATVAIVAYVIVILMADSRRSKIEQSLPDFLTLASSNVRAGMTIDQAMWYAAKPEFGLLSKEVELVAKQAFGGVPFAQALDGLATRVNSRNIRRMVALVKQGLASGGEVAEILERTSEDTRNMQIIKRDISASLLMYIIFIVFAAAIGTPFLFAVSSKLILILEGVFSQMPDTSGAAIGGASFIKFSPPVVSSYQFFMFVLVSTATTAFFSSLMIGTIQRGSKMEGIKYLPFLLLVSIVVFLLISSVLDSFLGGIGGF